MRLLTAPSLALLAAVALAAPALAAPLVIVPFTNGKFEASLRGWTPGPGVGAGDGDYTGDVEAIVRGEAAAPRLRADLSHLAFPATVPLAFTVDFGRLLGVTYAVRVIDATNSQAYLDPEDATALVWTIPDATARRYDLDPAAADFPAHPHWGSMSAADREAELARYLYADVAFTALACVDDFGCAVDDFGYGVEKPALG